MEMSKVVITGATSMIGVALTEACVKNGVQVYAVVRENSGKVARLPDNPLVHTVVCELEQLERLPALIEEKCDVFYHIAWAHTGAVRNRSIELQKQNIDYTMQAVHTAKQLGCRRFVGAGSQAEYGPLSIDRISPDTPVRPTTAYGVCKLAAGQMAFLLAGELGLECIWPRIFSVYGIHEKETAMVADSLRKMPSGEETSFTPGEQIWDYLFSRDAGRAYYLIGEKGRDGSIYCVGSGEGRPLRDYIEQMAQITGASARGIGRRPYPPGPRVNLCADIRSLTEDTGFVPEYTFEEGIGETIAWLQQAR